MGGATCYSKCSARPTLHKDVHRHMNQRYHVYLVYSPASRSTDAAAAVDLIVDWQMCSIAHSALRSPASSKWTVRVVTALKGQVGSAP